MFKKLALCTLTTSSLAFCSQKPQQSEKTDWYKLADRTRYVDKDVAIQETCLLVQTVRSRFWPAQLERMDILVEEQRKTNALLEALIKLLANNQAANATAAAPTAFAAQPTTQNMPAPASAPAKK